MMILQLFAVVLPLPDVSVNWNRTIFVALSTPGNLGSVGFVCSLSSMGAEGVMILGLGAVH